MHRLRKAAYTSGKGEKGSKSNIRVKTTDINHKDSLNEAVMVLISHLFIQHMLMQQIH